MSLCESFGTELYKQRFESVVRRGRSIISTTQKQLPRNEWWEEKARHASCMKTHQNFLKEIKKNLKKQTPKRKDKRHSFPLNIPLADFISTISINTGKIINHQPIAQSRIQIIIMIFIPLSNARLHPGLGICASWFFDFQTPPPSATVMPNPIPTIVPAIINAINPLTASLCFRLSLPSHLDLFCLLFGQIPQNPLSLLGRSTDGLTGIWYPFSASCSLYP